MVEHLPTDTAPLMGPPTLELERRVVRLTAPEPARAACSDEALDPTLFADGGRRAR